MHRSFPDSRFFRFLFQRASDSSKKDDLPFPEKAVFFLYSKTLFFPFSATGVFVRVFFFFLEGGGRQNHHNNKSRLLWLFFFENWSSFSFSLSFLFNVLPRITSYKRPAVFFFFEDLRKRTAKRRRKEHVLLFFILFWRTKRRREKEKTVTSLDCGLQKLFYYYYYHFFFFGAKILE